MAASARETRAVYKQITPQHNSLKIRVTPKLAATIRHLINKHSTFLRHKAIRALPNAYATVL